MYPMEYNEVITQSVAAVRANTRPSGSARRCKDRPCGSRIDAELGVSPASTADNMEATTNSFNVAASKVQLSRQLGCRLNSGTVMAATSEIMTAMSGR